MEPETLLNLYDSYWFNLDLFSRKIPSNFQKISEIPPSNPEIPTLRTIHTKSSSPVEKISSKFSPHKKLSDSSSSASPNSVLFSPKLQTIFSGRISEEFEIPEVTVTTPKTGYSPLKGNLGRRRKNKGLSKSLSDLEFEELKGFIDLGFVFSEEDKDSTLANIIPGLHRLKNSNSDHTRVKENDICSRNDNDNDNSSSNNDDSMNVVDKINEGGPISRPYLSEAWEVLEKKRRENFVLNRRVPAPDNEVQMKDYLKFWAHTVASTVK